MVLMKTLALVLRRIVTFPLSLLYVGVVLYSRLQMPTLSPFWAAKRASMPRSSFVGMRLKRPRA